MKKLKIPGIIWAAIWLLSALSDIENLMGNGNLVTGIITLIFGTVLFYFMGIGIAKLVSKKRNNNRRASIVMPPPKTPVQPTTDVAQREFTLPDWHISISFGKSASAVYNKALALAKAAPQYHEQTDNGNILHQAIYSAVPREFMAYLMLYELVGSWKSSFIIINGKLMDSKVVKNINRCYGDKCRMGNNNFCSGASYMSVNPFGCHRLQINAANNPWWQFYEQRGMMWVLNRAAMKERIDSYAAVYCVCPVFNYDRIMAAFYQLPDRLSDAQFQKARMNDLSL